MNIGAGAAAVRPVSKPFIVNLDILVILHGSIQEDMILEFLQKMHKKVVNMYFERIKLQGCMYEYLIG